MDVAQMNNLGVIYDKGQGVAKDYGKAREWYQRAAEAGDTNAMDNMGWLYQNGRGGARTMSKRSSGIRRRRHRRCERHEEFGRLV